MPRSTAAPRIYKVNRTHNEAIRVGDPFKGRLLDTDWVVALGQGAYMVVQVSGERVMGLPEYRFAAKTLGRPIRWNITDREVALLRAGETIEAPMDLDAVASIDRPAPVVARRTREDTRLIVGESN